MYYSMYNICIMKRIDTHLAEQQIAKLKLLSKRTGLSKAELIRRAVDRYLKEEGGDQEYGNFSTVSDVS